MKKDFNNVSPKTAKVWLAVATSILLGAGVILADGCDHNSENDAPNTSQVYQP
jgi:hypothetical protein